MRLFLLSAILFWAGSALAQDEANPNKGRFYVAPGIVAYQGPDTSRLGYEDTEIGVGLILGYGLSDHWSVEVMGAQVEADFDNRFGSGEEDVDLKWLNFVYHLPAHEAWQPFLLVGGGRTDYDFGRVRADAADNQLNAGVGVYRQLTDHISLRADLRGVSSSKTGGLEPFAFIGITGFIGSVKAPAPPADADGDGVPDYADQCPGTPTGRIVDAAGCELDADGDGVVDGIDQCPDTPKGAPVDASGCPLDTDGDGVPDYRDDCPDSAVGAKVDEKGCYIELEEEVTIDLNINFDTNTADIRTDHTSELARAVEFLRQYPTTSVVIEGHTDSDGAASYNQSLSERRAKAVRDYLAGQAGVDANRLTSVGFGESRPIAGNDTAAGKQRNRRVSAVFSNTQ